MIIAVLEWNSDSGVQPIVLVAEDIPSARRAAVRAITPHLPIAADVDPGDEDPNGGINYIDREWVRNNPLPALDNAAEVAHWLAAFKEETTDLWLNLYGKSINGGVEDAYVDTRTGTTDGL